MANSGYIVRVEERDKQKMMVAAIDFGTTFSGYAFAFKNDIVRDALRIHGNQWTSGASVSLKTSTCALFNPRQELDSFGSEAEDRYAEMAVDNVHHDWYYFRRFKMMLYNNQVNLNLFELTKIRSTTSPYISPINSSMLDMVLCRAYNLKSPHTLVLYQILQYCALR